MWICIYSYSYYNFTLSVRLMAYIMYCMIVKFSMTRQETGTYRRLKQYKFVYDSQTTYMDFLSVWWNKNSWWWNGFGAAIIIATIQNCEVWTILTCKWQNWHMFLCWAWKHSKRSIIDSLWISQWHNGFQNVNKIVRFQFTRESVNFLLSCGWSTESARRQLDCYNSY